MTPTPPDARSGQRASRSIVTCLVGLVGLVVLAQSCSHTDTGPRSDTAIKQLYATREGGREWAANWDNGEERQLRSGQPDPFDGLVKARGNGQLSINGTGTATISGTSPRIYVYDDSRGFKWGDVEITVYASRQGETKSNSSQGLVIGGRSEHQDTPSDACMGQTYYGRLLFDGRVGFQKELVHDAVYSDTEPRNLRADWDAFGGSYPKNVWIGLKFVIRNIGSGSVSLELYRDLTGGQKGGDWQLMAEFTDDGQWTVTEREEAIRLGCKPPPPAFLDPATSVFLRNDDVTAMSYRGFTIREIDPQKRLF